MKVPELKNVLSIKSKNSLQTKEIDSLPSALSSEFKTEATLDIENDQIESLLYLSVQFPLFALEVINQTLLQTNNESIQCDLVFEEVAGRFWVYQASKQLLEKGISAGMALSAAYALESNIESRRRDYTLEQAQLEKVASWLTVYSSDVSLMHDDALVIEIRQSLKLYKGIHVLLASLKSTLVEKTNFKTAYAVAPTPMAAYYLACAQKSIIIENSKQLRSVLAKLTVYEIGLENEWLKTLGNIGIRYLQELWRLPRTGLLKRFGKKFLDYIDKLLGESLDPQITYTVPDFFCKEIEMPIELSQHDLILVAVETLIKQLVVFLRQIDASTDQIKIIFRHYSVPETEIIISFRYANRDHKQIFSLLRERFNQIKLKAGVLAIQLESRQIYEFKASNVDLFPNELLACEQREGQALDQIEDNDNWLALCDELAARLGENKLSYVHVKQDYRPEYAWAYRRDRSDGSGSVLHRLRPICFLATSIPISVNAAGLYWQSELSLLSGPERIESGWWDNKDMQRDYYLAIDEAGQIFWIYRDLKQSIGQSKIKSGWYLQGLFG